MKTFKAHAIFEDDQKEEAEAYFEDLRTDKPFVKMFRLSKNASVIDGYKAKNGGWVVASKKAMFYETKNKSSRRTGIL